MGAMSLSRSALLPLPGQDHVRIDAGRDAAEVGPGDGPHLARRHVSAHAPEVAGGSPSVPTGAAVEEEGVVEFAGKAMVTSPVLDLGLAERVLDLSDLEVSGASSVSVARSRRRPAPRRRRGGRVARTSSIPSGQAAQGVARPYPRLCRWSRYSGPPGGKTAVAWRRRAVAEARRGPARRLRRRAQVRRTGKP